MYDEDKAARQSGGINIGGGQADVRRDMIGRDQITINQYGLPVSATAALAPHHLPPPPRDFTGRKEELDELRAAIEKGGVTISGLQGLGGVGKTALALKLADELKQRYPDAQFYLDLKGVSKEPISPKDAMGYVIRSCHPEIKLPENEAELAGMYQSVLHGKQAILLMDNAKDEAQIEPLIPPESCLLIVTSRQRFAVAGLEAKNLGALSPTDAGNLILSIAKRLANERRDYAGDLARLCGYLPLALRSVAKVLAARIDLNPEDYLRKLADARERLKQTAADASLGLSYDLLPARLQKRFLALSVFPGTFEIAGAAAVWDGDHDPAQDSLSELGVYSLVEFNSTSSRYRLHDLVRVFADSRLASDERSAKQKRHAIHYKNVIAAANYVYAQGNEWLRKAMFLLDTEWTNIQSGQAWAAEHSSDDDESARLCSEYSGVGAQCVDLRLHPRERIRWREAGLTATRRLHDRRAESAHLGNLGNAYASLGEYRRAIEYQEQALRIARETGDRRSEGGALGNLGNALHSLGEYKPAAEYYEQALQIAREIGDERGEGSALGNLGNICYSLGEYRRAIELHEQALAIDRKMRDRRGEGEDLSNLGIAYQSLGEYRRAIEYQEQFLIISREIGNRRGEGNALGNLGNAYALLDEHERAIEYQKQALQIAREIGDRRGEGNALGNLGSAYHSLGDNDHAIEHHKQCLQIAREIGDRRGEGSALGNMGNTYHTKGNYALAVEHHELQVQLARIIGDRCGEGNGLYNLSRAFERLGDRAKAIGLVEAALRVHEQIDSPTVGMIRKQLAEMRGEGEQRDP